MERRRKEKSMIAVRLDSLRENIGEQREQCLRVCVYVCVYVSVCVRTGREQMLGKSSAQNPLVHAPLGTRS